MRSQDSQNFMLLNSKLSLICLKGIKIKDKVIYAQNVLIFNHFVSDKFKRHNDSNSLCKWQSQEARLLAPIVCPSKLQMTSIYSFQISNLYTGSNFCVTIQRIHLHNSDKMSYFIQNQ